MTVLNNFLKDSGNTSKTKEHIKECMGVWKKINSKWFLNTENEIARISLIQSNGLFIFSIDHNYVYSFYIVSDKDISTDPLEAIDVFNSPIKDWDENDMIGLFIEALDSMLGYEDNESVFHTVYGGKNGQEGLVLSHSSSINAKTFLERIKQEYVINNL